jgi:tetratricopeptide (TPR) repeat protein
VELLHFLARQVAGHRVLVVAMVRAEERHTVLDPLADVADQLDLGALPAEAVGKLAAAAGQRELADEILRRTRGHALFVVETLRGLAAGDAGVPRSLHDVVLSRVRRAGRPVEDLLRAAAVLGSSFDPATLAGLLSEPLPPVVARCEDALDARLLVVSGREYEFSNDLIREVLYASTPAPTRLSYHLRAADLLTQHPESVAAHATAAEDWPRAARAWLLAGEQALRHFAADDAEELLNRCVAVTVRAEQPEVRGRALVARARAHEARTAYAAAIADLEGAVDIAREVGDRRLEMIALRQLGGSAPIGLGHSTEQIMSYLRRGLQLAVSLGDRAMEADLLAWLAIISSNALRFDEAVEHGRRAVIAARASGDEQALAAALDGRKTSVAYLGEIEQLAPVLDELEPLLRRLDDPFRLHWALFEAGFPALAGGDWTAAAACFHRALEASRRSGFAAYACWHVGHLGMLARLEGDYDRALELGRHAIVLNQQSPHAWCGASSAALLGTTLLEVGADAEAIAVLERGRRLAAQDGSESYLLRCLGPLAEATGSADVLAQADAMLSAIAAPAGSAWMTGDGAYLAVARAWLARGEAEHARAVLAPLLAAAQRIPWVAPLAAASLIDGRAAAVLGLDEDAHALFVRAADLAQRHHLPRIADDAAKALA